jgi:hypothetical protein
MVIYVAVIAIANIGIGWILGRYVPFAPAIVSPGHAAADETEFHARENDAAEEFDSVIADQSSENAEDEAAVERVVEPTDTSATSPSVEKTWSDYTNQLREIAERTKYCRDAKDRQLARQATAQLATCVDHWYSAIQAGLEHASGDATDILGLRNVATAGLEMYSSQIETSLSNIRSLDWTADFDVFLAKLETELHLLDDQQKLVQSRP